MGRVGAGTVVAGTRQEQERGRLARTASALRRLEEVQGWLANGPY